jgi:AbrB family looped-hinge helix DNA binding protein
MPVATLTSKGQLTMPLLVRESLGLEAGDKVDFVADPLGGYRVVPVRKDVKELRGRFVGRVSQPVSVEAMAEAVAGEAAARARRAKSGPQKIGIDSNVLVRYLTQDDARQSARASRFIERELTETVPGFVGLIALVEVCWVLKRLYGATNDELRDMVRDVLDARQLVVEQRAVVNAALARCGDTSGDLADALIAACARAGGCERIVTFDKAAVRVGMSLLR